MPIDSKGQAFRTATLQFVRYLASGGAAAVLAIFAYALFIEVGIWYVTASVLSDLVGLVAAFVFHKYLVFRKKEQIIPHAFRYILVQILNTVLQVAFLYVTVEFFGMDEVVMKIVSIGLTVPMNFFLYKYFVYV